MLDVVIPLYFLLPGVVLFAGITMLGTASSTSINKPENAVKMIQKNDLAMMKTIVKGC